MNRKNTNGIGQAKRVLQLLLAVGVVTCVTTVAGPGRASADQIPFQDPNVHGTITLCNDKLQPITSGSLINVPFVWRAVSSTPAPTGYTLAELYLAQPIQHVDAEGWIQKEMTAPSRFSNASHPMAEATYHDLPLLEPDVAAPPYWNGFYELRMDFTAPQQVEWENSYPAAVIRVTGTTWTLVQGGGGSCTDGNAVSEDMYYLPKSETEVPRTVPPSVLNTLPGYAPPHVARNTAGSSGPSVENASSSGAGSKFAAGSRASSTRSSSSSGLGVPIAITAVVLVAALLGGLAIRMRSRRRALSTAT